MSYIRASSTYSFVDGESKGDYVFCMMEKGKERIQDYGAISDATLVEFVCMIANERHYYDDKTFKDYVVKKLAERLNVPMRKKRLTDKQLTKLFLAKYKVRK
jgi:hypothetical protein